MFTLTGVSASQPDDNATVDALIPNQDDVAVKSNSIQDLILNVGTTTPFIWTMLPIQVKTTLKSQ